MSNLSKRKNDEINNKIAELKKYLDIKSAPEPIIHCLEVLKSHINTNKYGLVFEDHLEEIEEQLKQSEIILVEQKELLINKGIRVNLLIEGENLAVLMYMGPFYTCGHAFSEKELQEFKGTLKGKDIEDSYYQSDIFQVIIVRLKF